MKHILISGTIHIQTDVYQKVEGEHVSISTNIGGMGYELVKVFKKINQNATLLSLIGKDEYSHQIMS
ncbi:MAG TPA: hypothetical protein DCY20_11885, partial [Firmicutes bacterium]|nr:hypothetical protein [Bacillota bacterium]